MLSKTTKKRKLRKLLGALDTSLKPDLLVDQLKEDTFVNFSVLVKNITTKFQELKTNLLNELDDRISQFPDLSGELKTLRVEFEDKLSNLEKENIEPIQSQMQDIVSNDITTDENLRGDLNDKLEDLRKEFLHKLSNLGGGSQNQKVSINGTVMSSKYADINLKNGSSIAITAADNNTTKQVDVSIAQSGGTGDVVGPSSSTDNAIARFDGATGKVIQNSGVIIDDTGNVGIGIASPTKNIHIYKSSNDFTTGILVENPSSAADSVFALYVMKTSSGALGQFLMSGPNNNFGTATYGTDRLTFENNGTGGMQFLQSNGTAGNNFIRFILGASGATTEVMRIINGGKVGIGTVTPGALLEVKGDTHQIFTNFSTTDSYGGLIFQEAGTTKAYISLIGSAFGTANRRDNLEITTSATNSGGEIDFRPLDTLAWRINTAGYLLAGTDNTFDIGASGATRPRTGFFGTSVNTPLISVPSDRLTVSSFSQNIFLNLRWSDSRASAVVYRPDDNNYFMLLDQNTATSMVRSVNGNLLLYSDTSINFSTSQISRWDMNTSGHFLAATDNVYDIGASGATRPRTGYFGTSVVSPLISATTGAFTGAGSFNSLAVATIGTNSVFGPGGTASNVMSVVFDGSSASSGGPYLIFRRNSVDMGYVGASSALHGNNTNDIALIAKEAIRFNTNTDYAEKMRITADGLVGVGITPSGNGLLQVKSGSATTMFSKVGGVIADFFTDTSVGGAEADIYTTTTAASILATNGDKIIATYSGNFVTGGTELTQLKVYFAGTAIWDSTGVAPTTGTTSWRVSVDLIRVSASVIRYSVFLGTTGATGYNYETTGELTGLTLTNTNILKITGASSGIGSGAGDIVGKLGYVEWKSAA